MWYMLRIWIFLCSWIFLLFGLDLGCFFGWGLVMVCFDLCSVWLVILLVVGLFLVGGGVLFCYYVLWLLGCVFGFCWGVFGFLVDVWYIIWFLCVWLVWFYWWCWVMLFCWCCLDRCVWGLLWGFEYLDCC